MRSAFTCASHGAGLGHQARVVIPIHQDSDALRVAAKQSPLVRTSAIHAVAPFMPMPFGGCPPGHVPRLRSYRRTGYERMHATLTKEDQPCCTGALFGRIVASLARIAAQCSSLNSISGSAASSFRSVWAR